MTSNEDKILAIVCVIILIFSLGFFSFIKSGEEDKKDEGTSSLTEEPMLKATNNFLGSGKSLIFPRFYPKYKLWQ